MRQPAFPRVSRMSASGTAFIGAMTPLTFSPEKQYGNQRAPGVVARCSVELSVVAGQFGDVGDVEARLDTGLGSTGTGLLDRRRRAVEARHRVAATRQVDHVVAEAATSVEHLSADRAERFEFHKPRPRLSDVPRDGFGGGRARECGLSAIEAFVRLAIVAEGF
jgi:hypothetical protein